MAAKTQTDPWHYARPELAQKYLKAFDLGLTSAKGLFAKRRMGKSEFLEKDLIPAAQNAGYLTTYLNLWDARTQPTGALVAALQRTLELKGFAKVAQRLNTPLRKVKAGAKVPGLGEGSVEAELADAPSAGGPALGEWLRTFDKRGKRMLLVLDEAQVLADAAHSELAHSLRAGLDSRKQNIKVVFAGSSEPTLRRMFGRSTEPFYNWAPLEPFELLGADFVKALVAKVNKLSRFSLKQAEALEAFHVLKDTPEFFRRYLECFMTNADLGGAVALEHTLEHVFNDREFAQIWARLLPADQEVLKALANDVTDLHSARTLLRIGMALGLERAVSKNAPAQALKRLQDQELITRLEVGEYRFQDDAFAEWVKNRGLDG
ncbi:hypothetical protein J7E62_07775 [Variovorax paradoxus]|nr:hypothetical protein [Variovorax paradoxus]